MNTPPHPPQAEDHQRSIDEQLQYIGGHMMDREEMAAVMRDAVAEGIRAAVSDPALWSAAGDAMQQQATKAAGGWLFSGLRAAMSRIGWVLVIGLAVYMVGGWTALVKAWHALGSGGHP